MKAVLLSVRPIFAKSLLAGTKTAEVRRRFPDHAAGTKIFVYSSTPDRAVLGTVLLTGIHRTTPRDVWVAFHDQIEIAKADLDDYLADAPAAAILKVSDPEVWVTPVSLSELRTTLDLEPAQSFRYLTHEQGDTLSQLGQRRAGLTARTA